MHILIILAVLMSIVLYFLLRGPTETSQDTASDPASDTASPFPSQPSASQTKEPYALAFISNGKLFYQAPGEDIRELQSPHVQGVMERMVRHQEMHAWKDGTAFGTSFTGQANVTPADAVQIQAKSAQFVTHHKMLYILQDESFGGLFEYDLAHEKEKRLVHKQQLALDDLRISPDGRRLLCAQHAANGAANIVGMDVNGDNLVEMTSGDTVDAAPSWVPDQKNAILFQSSGLARNEAGFVLAQGPTSIQMADTTTGTLTTVLEDPRQDFLQPRVGPDGSLYFIRRPYEAPRYGVGSAIADTLLFPFRLLRAIFHYLNFFSLMYTRKPLTTASGPAMQADLKNILVKGKRLDAEAALRSHARLNGVPSLVPSSWQLIRRSPEGREHVLAKNVASFDFAWDGTILFSNGYGVFALDTANRPRILLKDKLITDIIVAPEYSAPRVQIW